MRKHTIQGKHPNKLFVLARIACAIFPFMLFLIITAFVAPAPNSSFLVLGYVGSAVLGISGAFLLGVNAKTHSSVLFFLIGCLSVGAVLISMSVVILYIPAIYAYFDKDSTDYYIALWTFFLIPIIWYSLFRSAVVDSLRNKQMSKTKIKNLMKGKKNYWFYEQIHNETSLGLIYHINKVFIVIFSLTILVHLVLGWIHAIKMLTAVLFAISCIMCSFMWAFTSVTISQSEFGKKFIPLGPVITGKTKKWYGYSSLAHLGGVVFPLLVGYATIKLVLK